MEGEHGFASVRLHHTMMGRSLIKETTLSDYIKNPSQNPDITFDTHKGKLFADEVSL